MDGGGDNEAVVCQQPVADVAVVWEGISGDVSFVTMEQFDLGMIGMDLLLNGKERGVIEDAMDRRSVEAEFLNTQFFAHPPVGTVAQAADEGRQFCALEALFDAGPPVIRIPETVDDVRPFTRSFHTESVEQGARGGDDGGDGSAQGVGQSHFVPALFGMVGDGESHGLCLSGENTEEKEATPWIRP